ncbi:hypothetical protein CI610_01031 [invertebrate metagenome]|uniref:Integrase catalytic domain-containing protein n=1 Tax=invertebrate metagenome TaxID=1711999 RepID=A0A2H9T9U5_9ZZZZ
MEKQERLADWEGDTVYGQNAHLMTLVDRKIRLTLIGKVSDKKAETVAKKMIELMRRVPGAKTITLDNGGEFAQHSAVLNSLQYGYLFCQAIRRLSAGNQ